MKLIEPSAEIIHVSGDLKTIELSARNCYKSEDRISDDYSSAEKLVGVLNDHGHYAMFEFVDVTVRFITDRAIANEIVRHRIASYAQSSTRYINYKKKDMEFIEPYWAKHMNTYDPLGFESMCKQAEENYIELIEQGRSPQEARDILPLCLKTELIMKTNLRSWKNFFEQRTSPAAHPEMRRITIPLLKEFQNRIPIIFDDIIP